VNVQFFSHILDLDAGGAAHGDGFQVLRAHHGADAGATRGAVEIVYDAGVAGERFAGAPDRGDADAPVLMARAGMGRAAMDLDVRMQHTFPRRAAEPTVGRFGDQDILIAACRVLVWDRMELYW